MEFLTLKGFDLVLELMGGSILIGIGLSLGFTCVSFVIASIVNMLYKS